MKFEIWKLDMRDFRDRQKKRNKNDAKVFALILGQCSRPIRDRIEADPIWNIVDENSQVIDLLKLIRQALYTGRTIRKKAHSRLDADRTLKNFVQGERMTNSEYLEKFKGLVEVVEHFGAEIGQSSDRIAEHMPTTTEADEETRLKMAKARARESYLAIQFFVRSDPQRYSDLVADIENMHTRGNDAYPETISAAYDMLVNYKTTNKHRFQQQDSGMAFYSEGGSTDGRGRGGRHGGRGRGRGYYGNARDTNAGRMNNSGAANDNGQANENRQENDGQGQNHLINNSDNYNSDNSTNYDHAYSNAISKRHLPKSWILLDSCSSVDIISDKGLLNNIHQPDRAMNVHCNAGTVLLDKIGTIGKYPEPVWFNEGGIANIMSLYNVTQHYRVTMDTEQENCFVLHRKDGTYMKFEPCAKGLYRYVLQNNETAGNVWNMLLTLDMWNLVTTVKSKADRYTKRAYKRAVQARKLQKIIMNPGARELMDVSINHLKDCTISRGDIIAAEDILGPSLGALKGKTVHRPNAHTRPGIDPVEGQDRAQT